MNILSKLAPDVSAQFLKRHARTVSRINSLEAGISPLSDLELRAKADGLKGRIRAELSANAPDPVSLLELAARVKEKKRVNGVLDPVLPEAFALVREAAVRAVGQRHFDVQLLGGIALHSGDIAEMRTGEGKTLVATLPLSLNALAGRGAHLVTVNDYLAKHGVMLYGPVYALLGLSVGVITNDASYMYDAGRLVPADRRAAYACDVTYGTNNEFGFDYLRDNMAQDASQLVQRDLFFAIVDEVDSILIDEARTPLIISGPAEEAGEQYRRFAALIPKLEPELDFVVDEKDRVVSLTRDGIVKMEQLLGVKDIYGAEVQLAYHLEEALRARILFRKDKEYVVRDGEVIIVDEFTGRMMPGRRYSEGLHQAIEAKEGVEVRRENVTMATISFQNLFRLYVKLGGMTGTANTEAEEFMKIYGLEVITVPTNRPMVRSDGVDQVYKTEPAKLKAIVDETAKRHAAGQPVLIGTISIEKNEQLGKALAEAGVPHQMLNAKNHEREADIIMDAGRPGAVTLATNMAGRGTDIVLGGIAPELGAAETERLAWQAAHDDVVAKGGLHVVGTERHESRRIDNQLRGRAGRQGDPGSSAFYISTEDDLMRIFGGDRLKGWLNAMGVPDEEVIEHKMLSRSIETAQKRVEGHNFDARKRVIQYDDVLTRHREVIYRRRRTVLLTPEKLDEVEEGVERAVRHESRHLAGLHASGFAHEWNLEQLTRDLAALTGLTEEERVTLLAELSGYQADAAVEERIKGILEAATARQRETFGPQFPAVLRAIYLNALDGLWVEHLTTMNELRTSVGLQSYAQNDPLVVYKSEGFRLFQNLVQGVDLQTMRNLLRVTAVREEAAAA